MLMISFSLDRIITAYLLTDEGCTGYRDAKVNREDLYRNIHKYNHRSLTINTYNTH